VSLFWDGRSKCSSFGWQWFCSQNQRRLHFGLGKNPQIDKAEIRWPSGKIETIDKPRVGKFTD
jgi:hypothetical protein